MRSRSGEPTWSSITSSPSPPPWSSSVSWEKADILKPSTYKPLLQDADAVIHTMGILLEADYKGVLQGNEPIWLGLQRAFSATKGGSQNPLERKEGEDLRPQEKDGQLTYELMNRDSGGYRPMRCNNAANKIPRSHNSRSRILVAEGALICIYLRGSRSANVTRPIYKHEEGGRVDHSLVFPDAAEYLYTTWVLI